MAKFHPEYLKAIEPMMASMAKVEKPAVHDVEGRRAQIGVVLAPLMAADPPPPDVEIQVYHTTTKDGFSLPIHHFRKKDTPSQGARTSLPALYHTHGGGYIALDVATYTNLIAAFCSTTGIQFFSVDYRLAPEHPFPIPPEDCYTGLLWLHEHAAQFNVDPTRIGIFGDSAGGGLAASVALMARDRNLSPPLAKQILIYPMIDDRNLKPHPLEQFMFWTSVDNITGWTAYVGKNAGGEGVSYYAAPARVENVEALPPTYMDVGFLDLFRDENMLYASRLTAANIDVEFHLYPGLPHAFEVFGKGTNVVNEIMATRIKAMMSF